MFNSVLCVKTVQVKVQVHTTTGHHTTTTNINIKKIFCSLSSWIKKGPGVKKSVCQQSLGLGRGPGTAVVPIRVIGVHRRRSGGSVGGGGEVRGESTSSPRLSSPLKTRERDRDVAACFCLPQRDPWRATDPAIRVRRPPATNPPSADSHFGRSNWSRQIESAPSPEESFDDAKDPRYPRQHTTENRHPVRGGSSRSRIRTSRSNGSALHRRRKARQHGGLKGTISMYNV